MLTNWNMKMKRLPQAPSVMAGGDGGDMRRLSQ